MRRVLVAITVTLLLIAINVPLLHADDTTTQFPIDVQLSGETSEADGNDYITFSLFVYGWYCAYDGQVSQSNICADGSQSNGKVGRPGHNIGIFASGSGNIFDGAKTSGSNRYVTADENGEAQFSLSSTKNEIKTLQFTDNLWGTPYNGATSVSVTFGKPDSDASGSGSSDAASSSGANSVNVGSGDFGSSDKSAASADTTSKNSSGAAASKNTSSVQNSLVWAGGAVAFLVLLGLISWFIVRRRKPQAYATPLQMGSAYRHNPYRIGHVALLSCVEYTP